MKENLNISLLKLAVPNIISNISTPLLASVDTFLMGNLSVLHLGAVGLGSMIFNFIYWNFGFLRMGTTGLTAQAFGKKDSAEQGIRFGQGVIVALAFGLIFLIFQKPLGTAAMYVMGVSAEQVPLVAEYFYTRLWDAPASFLLFVCFGWFFGMQNVFFPLIVTVFINIINIGLSWHFVHNLGMGIHGVALGTVCAQYAGLTLALSLLAWRYRPILRQIQGKLLFRWAALERYLKINNDIFLRTICLTLAFTLFYRQSAQEGALILAANTVLMQFINWMSYGVDGFAYASESLVGRFEGAKDKISLNKTIRIAFLWGMALAVLYALVYGIKGMEAALWFSDNPEVVDTIQQFLPWVVLFPILATPCYIWDGIFVGLAAAKAMRNMMALSFGVFLLCLWGLSNLGNHGLWAALLAFMVVRGISLTWAYNK